jgi:hypothetical protein
MASLGDVVVVVRKMQTRLSALGQKRTYAVQNVMSALPPKADKIGESLPISSMQQMGNRMQKAAARD